MSELHVNRISNRLILRKPQLESLEILQKICDIATLEKDADTKYLLKVIQSEFSGVTSFDRDFPSLCFALATGVGKTRLMGAFISYLHLSEGIQDFVVLASNLTIYNKLIADFTPNTSKYVFKGISEFAQNPPVLITGGNYESGVGVRDSTLFQDAIHINVFNISKIIGSNNDARKIRRLSECIGESYFDYLAGLDDLVVLMDESQRYRASAGMKAINELKPILGLDLTATPQVEKGTKTEPFQNIIYNYPIANALIDGYIKEPAVATRENFDASNYSPEGLEEVKLKDSIIIHENTKSDLEVYARQNEQAIVKPFMLVVAQDTNHANDLQTIMESEDFFEGRYKGKVITVHSNTTGEEKGEVVEKLLNVEHRENPVEVVIHVNMLKEGWDVTNLYTIVPLRAANSRTLVEQSIGRGLRLPYGKRVGVPAVDRLTIVSHDRFQDIVDHANDPDSIIRKTVLIGQDIPEEGKKAVTIKSGIDDALLSGTSSTESTAKGETVSRPTSRPHAFKTDGERKIAQIANRVMERFEHLSSSKSLLDEKVQKEIAQAVEEDLAPYQSELGIDDKAKPDVAAIVKKDDGNADRTLHRHTQDHPRALRRLRGALRALHPRPARR